MKVNDNLGNIGYKNGFIILDTIPPHSLSISINEGAKETTSRTVTLKLNAEDTHSGVYKMSFSFDKKTWTPWDNYSKEALLELSAGNGLKPVYFKVMDFVGNTAEPVNAHILLNMESESSDGSIYNEDEQNKYLIYLIMLIVLILLILIFSILIHLSRRKRRRLMGKEQVASTDFAPDRVSEPYSMVKPIRTETALPGGMVRVNERAATLQPSVYHTQAQGQGQMLLSEPRTAPVHIPRLPPGPPGVRQTTAPLAKPVMTNKAQIQEQVQEQNPMKEQEQETTPVLEVEVKLPRHPPGQVPGLTPEQQNGK